MRKNLMIATVTATTLLLGSWSSFAADPKPVAPEHATPATAPKLNLDNITILLKAPVFSPLFAKFPVATVNDEIIYLEDVSKALEVVHSSVTKETSAKKENFAQILNRLITTHLITQEGRNIELDKQPEYIAAKKAYAIKLLREMALKDALKDVKPSPEDVDKRYKELTTEWKLKSIVFKDEASAKAMLAGIKAGKSFDALFDQAIKDGKGESKEEKGYLRQSEVNQQFSKEIASMKVGAVSNIMPLDKSFFIFRLEDQRQSDNPALKEQAYNEANGQTRINTLRKYRDQVIAKHIKENKKLFKKLDFEAKTPGFDKLAEDKRVLGEIKGEDPVTIADLADAIKEKFFHGVETAIKEKKVNAAKESLLYEIYSKRAIEKDGRVKGLDKSKEYLDKLKDYENSYLFGTFIEKAVRPDIKIQVADIDAYYKEHEAEFSYPEMLRMDAIAFTTTANAQTAIDKLRKGMDFKWLKDNADGKVNKDAADQLQFQDTPVLTRGLEDDMQKALTGVKAGEYRLYTAQNGYNYVIYVKDIIPSRVQALPEVQDDIMQKLYVEKLNKALDDWSEKLRAASDVKIYAQFDK